MNLRVASGSFLLVSMVSRSSSYNMNLSKTSFEKDEIMREQYCIHTFKKILLNLILTSLSTYPLLNTYFMQSISPDMH